MATAEDAIAFLDEYRQNKERFLPLIDHVWKTFPRREEETGDVNIGWDAGVFDGNRPYFCELWSSGYMFLTYFISTIGIENCSDEQLEQMLKDAGLVWYKEREYPIMIGRKSWCE